MDRFPPASTQETPGTSPAPPFIRTRLNSSRPGPPFEAGPLSHPQPIGRRTGTHGFAAWDHGLTLEGVTQPPLFEALTD